MALLVQKFGGSSLATLEHINRAADIVAKTKKLGHKIVVIVSAMGGETDRLIGLANAMSHAPDAREYAALVSTGEQVSMSLFAMALINRGIKACSYTGAQAGIQTCSQYKKARIQSIDTQFILKAVEQETVVVIAGFQGVDSQGNITTLGRGGSDTTAVAIAAALNAYECQIYTDVDGVYTTDPRIVPDAKRLDCISFEEMLELSSLGAKVLQIRAVEFAGKYNIPLRVLSSATENPGTLITYHEKTNLEEPVVKGIAFSRHEAKITIKGIHNSSEMASIIMAEMSKIGVNTDMIMQYISAPETTDFVFTVHKDEYPLALKHTQKLIKSLQASQVKGVEKLAKLSLVGAGLKSHPKIAAIMFKTLATENIAIQLINSSEIKISVIVEQKVLDQGIKALHAAFGLDYLNQEPLISISTPAALLDSVGNSN